MRAPTASPELALLEAKAESAKIDDDLWSAFQSLSDVMGEASFFASLRAEMDACESAKIPEVLEYIWRVRAADSLLTLNVDNLAERAYYSIRRKGSAVSVFSGKHASNFSSVLQRKRPFVSNLHGLYDAVESWVFRKNDLDRLFRARGYKRFIETIFMTKVVIFVGISADDAGASGFLSMLRQQQIGLGSHFWITDRTDIGTHRWAQNAGIQIIRYNAIVSGTKKLHAPVLVDIFRDLTGYVSRDTSAPTVRSLTAASAQVIEANSLMLRSDDEIRSALSQEASRILNETHNVTSDPHYVKFLEKFKRPMFLAWRVETSPPDNFFMGRKVIEQISSGAYSGVWRVQDSDNKFSAMKLLHMDNLAAGPQIESFRRGIRSLQILSAQNLKSTPKLLEAHEVPTYLFMEYVEGPSLLQVVKSSEFRFWEDGLQILIEVGRHLMRSHELFVLHRDLRPSNVMVPNFFIDDEYLDVGSTRHEVRLLNFDMSWHKDAAGKTISAKLEWAGFYAPEHIKEVDGQLSRSSLVDAYGFGMLIYFCAALHAPPTGGGAATEWRDVVRATFRRNANSIWRSAAPRMRRLVLAATNVVNPERPRMSRLVSELEQVADAISMQHSNLSPDFWAEELAVLVDDQSFEAAAWDATTFKASVRKGRTIEIGGDLRRGRVFARFQNQATESTDRSGIDRLWTNKLNNAKTILESSGWDLEKSGTRYVSKEILLSCSISVAHLQENKDAISGGLIRALNEVRLD